MDGHLSGEVIIIDNLVKAIPSPEFRRTCRKQEAMQPFLLDILGVFHKELHLMDALLHDPGKNGIENLHADKRQK